MLKLDCFAHAFMKQSLIMAWMSERLIKGGLQPLASFFWSCLCIGLESKLSFDCMPFEVSPLQFPLTGSPQWEEYSIENQFSCYFHKPCGLVGYRNLCMVITLKCVQRHRFLRDCIHSVCLFFFFFFKVSDAYPKIHCWSTFSKYLFFRNPPVGSLPVVLVVKGWLLSFNMDVVLTIAVINHFGYWYSP